MCSTLLKSLLSKKCCLSYCALKPKSLSKFIGRNMSTLQSLPSLSSLPTLSSLPAIPTLPYKNPITEDLPNPINPIDNDIVLTHKIVCDLIYKIYCFKLTKLNEILASTKIFSRTKMINDLKMDYVSKFKNNMTISDFEYCKQIEKSYYTDLIRRLE